MGEPYGEPSLASSSTPKKSIKTSGQSLVEEHQNSINTPYKFNGKELDDETGNYYYGARYYNPKFSFWLSVDPLAEKYHDISSYIYTLNNPIKYIDPDGREVINGETARKIDAERQVAGLKSIMDKNGWNKDMTRRDFKNGGGDNWKSDFKNFKKVSKALKSGEKNLQSATSGEILVQKAIDNFKKVDSENFNKLDNLQFKDSENKTHDLDVTVLSGASSKYGGGVTLTSYDKNSKGEYASIKYIEIILGNGTDPFSNVFAHEGGHAYNISQNPAKSMSLYGEHNCQDPNNRNTFRSKTAMDWQERYDERKRTQN